MLVLVVGGNFGRTRVRGNIATVYRLLAGVVALRESSVRVKERMRRFDSMHACVGIKSTMTIVYCLRTLEHFK